MRGHGLGVLGLLIVMGCADAEGSAPVAGGGGGGGGGGAGAGAGKSGSRARGGSDAGISAPQCDELARAAFAGQLLDERGERVDASFSAHVDVVEVTGCAGKCSSDTPADAFRIVLEDPSHTDADAGPGAARWTLVTRLEGLPAELIQAGQRYDLTLSAAYDPVFYAGRALSQTVVLARDGALVLALATHTARFVRVPDLSAFGLSLEQDGVTCQSPNVGLFGERHFGLRATAGSEHVSIPRGGSAQLGELELKLVAYDAVVDEGFSDRPHAEKAGPDQRACAV